jgi:hypothetical protein
MVGATVTCRPATPPLRAVRARSVGGVRRRGSGRAVTPGQPLGFPRGSRRVVVPAQPPAPRTPCPRLRAGHPLPIKGTLGAGVSPPLCGGGPPGVTGVVIPVLMAGPTTAGKRSVARLRAGSARGMACRQSRSTFSLAQRKSG